MSIFTDAQLRTRDIDTLKRFLRYKLGGYRVAIMEFSADNLLYRGVAWSERPSLVSQLSYPPVDRVTEPGRLNRAGHSMFYASRGAPPVFFEMRTKPGDLVALSEWQVTEPLRMHHLGYHEHALRRLGGPLRPRLVQPIPNETKANRRLRQKLSLAFTEDIGDDQKHRYKQPIAINELLFDGASPLPSYPEGPRTTEAAGTAYPAMRMTGAADNLAIRPEFVDRYLRIRSVRYILVETADEAARSYTLLTLSMSHSFSDGAIIWEDMQIPESQRRSRISFEQDKWVLRDGENHVYDVH